jgi:hypothetical protein
MFKTSECELLFKMRRYSEGKAIRFDADHYHKLHQLFLSSLSLELPEQSHHFLLKLRHFFEHADYIHEVKLCQDE